MKSILIIGAGGHGEVCLDLIETLNEYGHIAFLDDTTIKSEVKGKKIIGKTNDFKSLRNDYNYAIVAIGNNTKRMEIMNQLKELHFVIPTLIHPKAYVSKYTTILPGTVVLAGAVVNTNVVVGEGCIVNINATIDHDTKIEDAVHVSAGAVIRSNSIIQKYSIVGARALVKSNSNVPTKYIIEDGSIYKGDEI